MNRNHRWPELSYEEWAQTCFTLHMWTQVVGKVRIVCAPWINHSWHATLYPTARGLTTSPLAHEGRVFQVDLDFHSDAARVLFGDGTTGEVPLPGQTISSFYRGLLDTLAEGGLPVRIHGAPNELPEAIPFAEDERGSYNGDAARRFHRVVLQTERVLRRFRSRFLGKCSPVHFFWGSFDLAVTRFSGRTAPEHPGGFPHLPDPITREAYSHEVSSAGFFPGYPQYPKAAFYSYAYPEPAGLAKASVGPAAAFYDDGFGEFLLPYDAVREAEDPDAALLEFLQTTYEAAADLAGWDREALERTEGPPPGFHPGP